MMKQGDGAAITMQKVGSLPHCLEKWERGGYSYVSLRLYAHR